MPRFKINTSNYSGYSANITYAPYTGGTAIVITGATLPYLLPEGYQYGNFSVYFPTYGKTCAFDVIPNCNFGVDVLVLTATPTPTLSATPIPTPSPTPSTTPSPTPSATPNCDFGVGVIVLTATPTPSATPSPTPSTTPSPSATPSPTPSATPNCDFGVDILVLTATPTPTQSATPNPTPSPSPSSTPEPTPSATANCDFNVDVFVATPTPTATIAPTPTPSSTPSPTSTPTTTPSPTPTTTIDCALDTTITPELTEVVNCLASMEFIVQYSPTLGPCPGGHQCNAATFYLRGNNVTIGTVYLSNNGFTDQLNYPPGITSGLARYNSLTLTTQQAQNIAASSTGGNISFSLVCATPINVNYGYGFGGCHTNVTWITLKLNAETIYSGCPNNNFLTINPCTGVIS